MDRRIVLAALLAIGFAIAAWRWADPTGSAPPSAGAAAPADGAPAPGVGAIVESAFASDCERELVSDAVATAEPAAAQDVVPHAPWSIHVRVVDEAGTPVGGADIALVGVLPDGGSLLTNVMVRESAGLVTGADGCVTWRARGEALLVSARKPGVGTSNSHVVERRGSELRELELTLEADVQLSGIVLDADRVPVADADVSCKSLGFARRRNGNLPSPGRARTDTDGRFVLPLRSGVRYELIASAGAERTFPVEVAIVDREPAPVELNLPGAITVSGTVFDVDGRPAPRAHVVAWRPRPGGADEQLRATAAGDGTYHLPLSTLAEYRVFASCPERASSRVAIAAPNATRPHVQLSLQLQQFAALRGRVVGPDGSSIANAWIRADPQDERTSLGIGEPTPQERFGAGDSGASDDDGRFELRVHPDSKWVLMASAAGHERAARRYGVRPGDDVVLVVGAQPCEVRATIRRADGAAVGGFDVHVVSRSGPLGFSTTVDAQVDGDAFVVPLERDRNEPFLRVVPHEASLAPATVGPVSTTTAGQTLDFVLVPWATVPVEVRDAGDAVMPDAAVVLGSPVAFGASVGGRTGNDGRVVLERCEPGRSRLRVRLDGQVVHDREVDVLPGANGPLLVRLP